MKKQLSIFPLQRWKFPHVFQCPLDILPPLYYNVLEFKWGPVAQLGARINRTDEVAGSNPARSTQVDVLG